MSHIAVADLREVSSSSLTPPSTPSIEVNRERLAHADAALSTTESLRRALDLKAPTNEVVRELYNSLISLERLCGDDSGAQSCVELKVLALSAKQGKDVVHAWYLDSLGDPYEFVMKCKLTPSLYPFDAKREPPTVSAVGQLGHSLAVIRQGLVNLARSAEAA